MAVMEIKFTYVVGNARFENTVDMDDDVWSDMDPQDRLDHLREAAMDDIYDNYILVEEHSIKEV